MLCFTSADLKIKSFLTKYDARFGDHCLLFHRHNFWLKSHHFIKILIQHGGSAYDLKYDSIGVVFSILS